MLSFYRASQLPEPLYDETYVFDKNFALKTMQQISRQWKLG